MHATLAGVVKLTVSGIQTGLPEGGDNACVQQFFR
jgi:hypothetical protein